jgi:hypothetical protein
MKGVTADVTLNGTGFHDQDDDTESPSKVVVAKEAAELEKLQRRLSVRDLTTQFESGQAAAKAAASKLAEEEVELLFMCFTQVLHCFQCKTSSICFGCCLLFRMRI